MGDIADDINEVFSLQSSVYKAIGEPHTSSASNPAGSRAPDTPQRPMPRVVIYRSAKIAQLLAC
jgi:hypothetical protein